MDHTPDFYKALLDNLTDGVYFVDRDRRITYWNRGAEKLTGYGAGEATGRRCAENLLVHVDVEGRELCLTGCPLEATIGDGKDRRAEVYLRHKGGHRVPVVVQASPIRNARGEILGAVEVFADHSAAAADRERAKFLERLALLDPLTEIGNRRYAEDSLRAKLLEAHRQGSLLALALLDVDHFKSVNDRYGHEVGDRVLRAVARTLAASTRASDVVGRWGGEEFVVAMTHADTRDALHATERLCSLVSSSGVEVEGQDLRVTVSAGLTLAQEQDDVEALVRRADGLLYESKRGGRNRVTADLPERPAAP